ncbi:MAG: hypothetical protein JOZ12_07005 [Sinobacteraceae bacterium]|nr:hypothetical protein [Nevskiaceae bacterium]
MYLARRYAEAIDSLSDGLALDPGDENTYGSRGLAYYVLGDLEKARSSCESKSYWLGQYCLEWLETALRLRDPGLGDLKADPLLDPIRKEPRFQAVERALKFPE